MFYLFFYVVIFSFVSFSTLYNCEITNFAYSQRKVERSSSPAAGGFEILRDDAPHIGGKGGKAPVKSEKTGNFRRSSPF